MNPRTYSVKQFMEAARKQEAELREEYARLVALDRQDKARTREVRADAARALGELSAALLPALSAEALARAVRLSGYSPLVQDSPIARLQAEQRTLVARNAAIEADPRHRDRVLLRAPRVGTLTRALAEVLEQRAIYQRTLEGCAHPRMARLIEVGYGGATYQVAWWRVGYYADWKAGDEVLARFPDKKTFAEVRADYLEARRADEEYAERQRALEAEIAAGEALEAEHARNARALETAPERALAGARTALGEHVRQTPITAIGPRLEQDADVALLAKRWSGLEAKATYLDQLSAEQVQKPASEIAEALRKLQADVVKMSRPKKAGMRFAADKFERRFQSRAPRFAKQRERYVRTYETIYVYEDYHHCHLASDWLWWDHMTHGRVGGEFIPEVRDFRGSHPGYQYQPAFDDSAAAAAIAGADGGSVGGSLVDAS